MRRCAGDAIICHPECMRTSTARIRAHAFYEHLAYEKLKIQYSFAKPVDPSHAAALRQFVPRVDSAAEPAT